MDRSSIAMAGPLRRASVCLAIILILCVHGCSAKTWKRCDDNGFCKRNRFLEPWAYEYKVEGKVKERRGNWATATLAEKGSGAKYELQMAAYMDGTMRVRIVEQWARRYEVEGVLTGEEEQRRRKWEERVSDGLRSELAFDKVRVHVNHDPFRLVLFRDGDPVMGLNDHGRFFIERTRKSQEENDTETMWEETFEGTRDSKPKGPQALSLDLSFRDSEALYGLPDRLQSLSLPHTANAEGNEAVAEPYRLFNLDIPHFESDANFGLYGSVPFLLAHSSSVGSVGTLWLNSAEMYVDVLERDEANELHGDSRARWLAESGIVDLFIFPGPEPMDVFRQHAAIFGGADMPQLWSLGFHQCRWTYRNQNDLLAVNSGFDDNDMPADVLWLDIDHTEEKKYLTWDTWNFPDPEAMQRQLDGSQRKLVTIVDPHIKREEGYWIHEEASAKGYYVKDADGKEDYKGHCWPGQVSYLDFTRPEVRHWFESQLSFAKYNGSTSALFIWNDMNEPSVFNGPEVTMPKDMRHSKEWEHRDVHNLYGHLYAMSTAQGLRKRSPGERPFVLTRAHFAGTQRHAAVWTGDNTADWYYLKVSVPQILRLNIAGISFSGADTGGFFYTPSDELMTRWSQLGAYYPFFRSHAHHETARQEPWLYGEPTRSRLRGALRERYSLIPYLYTLFAMNNWAGDPVWRPLWAEFPKDNRTLALDDEFLLGPSLLVRPVLEQGQTSVPVFLPGSSETWHDLHTGAIQAGGTSQDVEANLDRIPVYQRGGSVIARRERPRRSVEAQRGDPYTLYVAPDSNGRAAGWLYLDDGHSYDFVTKAQYAWVQFTLSEGVLESRPELGRTSPPGLHAEVERIVVLGRTCDVDGVLVNGEWNAECTTTSVRPLDPAAGGIALTIRKPRVGIGRSWNIRVQ